MFYTIPYLFTNSRERGQGGKKKEIYFLAACGFAAWAFVPVHLLMLLVGKSKLRSLGVGEFCALQARPCEIASLKRGAAQVGVGEVGLAESDGYKNRGAQVAAH